MLIFFNVKNNKNVKIIWKNYEKQREIGKREEVVVFNYNLDTQGGNNDLFD